MEQKHLIGSFLPFFSYTWLQLTSELKGSEVRVIEHLTIVASICLKKVARVPRTLPLPRISVAEEPIGDVESARLQQPLFLHLLWHDLLRKSCRKGLEWKVLDCSAERDSYFFGERTVFMRKMSLILFGNLLLTRTPFYSVLSVQCIFYILIQNCLMNRRAFCIKIFYKLNTSVFTQAR